MNILRELALQRNHALNILMSYVEHRTIHLITILAYHKVRKEDWDHWVQEISNSPKANIKLKTPRNWLKYKDLHDSIWYDKRDVIIQQLDRIIERDIIDKYNIPFIYDKQKLIAYLDTYNLWLIKILNSSIGKSIEGIPVYMVEKKLRELINIYNTATYIK